MQIASGWCRRLTGLFVQSLNNGVAADLPESIVVVKEYPYPTLKQLNQLGEMGELVCTRLDEAGYPEIVAVNTDREVLP